MRKPILIGTLAFAAAAGLATSALTQHEAGDGDTREGRDRRRTTQTAPTKTDLDRLYEIVREARADLDDLRRMAGIPRERGEHREGLEEHDAGHREEWGEHGGHRDGHGEHGERHREGRGEHVDGHREGREEEGSARLGKDDIWNATRNGARLILKFDAASQSFIGAVQNTTSKTLSEVRVEVHLSNGVELGPTRRTDLNPGEVVPVELSALDQQFSWWTTHPEHGSEGGHGPGHEREGAGEHGGDAGRPKDPALRPLYNQLQLLRHEIRMLKDDLASRRR